MRFYKVTMSLNNKDRDLDEISILCGKHSEKLKDNGFFFLSGASRTICIFGLMIRCNMDLDAFVTRFSKEASLDYEDVEIKETTLNDISNLLSKSDRNNFIIDDDSILADFDLADLTSNRRFRGCERFDEAIIDNKNKDEIYEYAKGCLTDETLMQELDRIYANTNRKGVAGHPVEYMIETDDKSLQNGVTEVLIQALYDVGRIESRRYCVKDLNDDERFSKYHLEALYKSCIGGTLVLDICIKPEDDEDMAYKDFDFLEDVCDVVRRHHNDVLTIIRLSRECTNLRSKIFENIGNCTFVEIKEILAFDDVAVSYLSGRAKEYRIRKDKKLTSVIEKGRGYLIPELNNIFEEWYDNKLKTSVYRQYKDISGVKKTIKEKKPLGSAYEELESMIGIDSAKKVIYQALDCYKAKVLFKEKGMKDVTTSNHMVFTGNPGTAKTTVARLFARILKENGVLSSGHIVEVGRGDLVGRYVGWTATIVKRKFKEARGGILFIDEAYSLVDDRNGSYGDEAINTIVQEMENNRDEVIVIFAGYPDEMEKFIEKNPGLRSRVAHYIHFEDYDTEELCRIASHIASKMGLVLEDAAVSKLSKIMDEAKKQPDFGNGRYVRNVIEKARIAQCSRLVHLNYEDVTIDDVKIICAEDIEIPLVNKKKIPKRIGFALE